MSQALSWHAAWVPARPWFILALAAEMIAVLALLSRPWLTGWLIDHALRGGDPLGLAWPALGLIATWLVRAGLGEIRERLLAGSADAAALGLRGRLLDLLLSSGGRAGDRLADAESFAGQAPRLALEAWSAVLRMAVGGGMLALIHPDLLYAILPSALLCALLGWAGRRIGVRAAAALAEAQAGERGRWSEAMGAHRAWTPPGWAAWMAGDLAGHAVRSARCETRLALATGWWQPAMAAAVMVGVVLVLVAGSAGVARGELTAGSLAAAIFMVFLAVGPLLELAAGAGRWAGAITAWRRSASASDAIARPGGDGSSGISWSALDVVWPDGRRLHLPAGEVPAGGCLLVSGRSGAGKSTLLRCLADRCIPAAGRIRNQARPILVGPDSVLPPWPLAQVLLAAAAAGGPAMDLAEVRREARRLGLDAVIAAHPEAYAARADRLHGTPAGQASLLLAARLARRPLLLDEATALLEPAVAATAIAGLRSDGTTVIAVAHRRQGLAGWPELALPG